MTREPERRNPGDIPTVVVPDIRDYTKINGELVVLLDAGHRLVKLSGVAGQRMLASGLCGDWHAVVVVEGDPGPELAAGLDAPNLSVVCTGSAKDGAGRGLKRGCLLVLGNAGDSIGYTQEGGAIAIAGATGSRAGLDQSGGLLVLGGSTGRLCGERQRGGRIVFAGGNPGPFSGRGRSGGEVAVGPDLDASTRSAIGEMAQAFAGFWPSSLPG